MKQKSYSALFTFFLFLSVALSASADEIKLSAKGEDNLRANLARFQGKMVTLQLDSGNEITGVLTEVGDETVHLSELVGKEYFDGLVGLDKIAALIVRRK